MEQRKRMQATVELDWLSLVLLIFAIWMAQHNYATSTRNRWYVLSALALMVVIGTELFAYTVADYGVQSQILPHILTNVVGFSLSPVVCYFLLFFVDYPRPKARSPFLAIPMVLNVVLSVLTYWTGWFFYVDAMNVYHRSFLFFLPTTITFFYYLLIIISIVKTLKKYYVSDRNFMVCIFLTPLFGTALQIIFPKILTLWPGIALSILLFYLFFLEQRYSIDALTAVRNRTTFMRDILKLQHTHNGPAQVVVLDITNLKMTNDNFGHRTGDHLLITTASLLESHFAGQGNAYRIGGDEFAVICTKASLAAVEGSCKALVADINPNIPLHLSLGIASCESCINSLYDTYIAADNAMYCNKSNFTQSSHLST